MSRRFALLVSFLFVNITVLVSQPKLLWTTTITNPDSIIQLSDAARDYSGNIYTVTFGGNTYGISLNKYSNTGTLIRETPLSNQITYKYWLAADKIGNAYVVTNDDQKKLTLTKYSPTGDSLWAKKLILSLPQNNYREGNSLINIDGDGNVYIATEHEQRIGDGFFRMYLMMLSYSPNGDRRWMDTTISSLVTTREAEYGDILLGKLTVDQSNNIIVSLTNRAVINPLLYVGETKILKYAPNGSGGSNPPQWIRTYSENPVNVEFNDMDVDNGGNIFVGYSGGKVRKYNSQGAFQWQRTVSGGMKLAADNNGGVYVGDGKFESFLKTIGRVFHFTDSESTYVGPFGSGNYNAITHIAVDQGGYVGVSGYVKSTFSAAEGTFNFYEYTPNGSLSGAVAYASPGVSYEIPLFLFKGNGSYTVVGQSAYPKSKSVLWIGKINVVPNPPQPQDPEPEKGWATQNSGTTADLYSVWFKQGSEGWAVGDSGTILHTMDAGNVWTKVTSPVQSDFKEIKFFNDTLGFIVGAGGIVRTGNGGTTWTKVSETGEQTLYAIAVNDTGMLAAVGTSGLIRISTDWGITWNTNNTNSGATLRDVEFFNGYFVAVGDIASVYIWPTISGWWAINTGGLFGQNLRAIQKNGRKLNLYGSIVGELNEQLTLRSSIEFPPTPLLSVSDNPKADLAVVTGELGTIGFVEEEKSIRYKTISPYDLNDVFQSGSFAVVVGDHGTIINFNNRTRISEHRNALFSSLTMIDPMTFIYSYKNKLFRSSDGGNRWSTVDSTREWINSFGVRGSTVWGSIKIDSQYTVMRSADKGATWQTASPLTILKQHPTINPLNGTTALLSVPRDGINDQPVFSTTNSGATWIPVDTVKADHQSRYHIVDSIRIWQEDIDLSNNVYSLRKRGIAQPQWITVFSDSIDEFSDPFTAYVLPNEEVILRKSSGLSEMMFHTVNGGIIWKKYPASIQDGSHVEHRTFANLSGFDLRMSTDGNFSRKTGPDYFFTNERGRFTQKDFGGTRQLMWTEDEQIVIEHPLQIDTSRIIDGWHYLGSLRKKAIGNPDVAADTIIVAPGTTGNVLKNIIVLADKISHTAIGDLTIILSHNGIADTLFHQLGFRADNIFNVVFSDASTNDLAFVRAPFSGEYRPFSPLEKFIGTNPAGAWILKIYDKTPADSGMLEAWSLKLESDHITSVNSTGLVPTEYLLMQNFPNPFNPTTMINYQLPMNSMVSLKIYDVLGREVETLVNEVVNAGTYSTPFNSTRLASGVYFYRIEATSTDGSRNRFVDVKKMMYLK